MNVLGGLLKILASSASVSASNPGLNLLFIVAALHVVVVVAVLVSCE